MRKINKIISVILSVVMTFSIVSITSYANEVMVISDEKDIVKITATPITIIENYDGYESFDYNGNAFFYYYTSFMWNDVDYIIEYEDGSAENLRYWEVEEKTGLSFDFSVDQHSSPFKLGINEIPFSFGEFDGVVELSIVENPVVGIDINDISIIEGTCGHYSDIYDEYGNVVSKYYNYSWYDEVYTVTLKDGSKIETSNGSIELYGIYYSLNINDNQSSSNPWGVGDHTATGSLFGIEDEFTVTIIESPIESIVCEDVEIIEKTNGWWSDRYNPETGDYDLKYYRYNPSIICKITLKNGNVITQNLDYNFDYNGQYYYIEKEDNQENSPWVVGETYSTTCYLMGKEFRYNVKIKETDIQSMTVTPSRPLYAGLDDGCSVLDYVLNIKYKDGTDEELIYRSSDNIFNGDFDVQGINEESLKVGTLKAKATYRGFTTTFDVQVLENPYDSLNISSEDGLTLYFTKKDGAVIEALPYYIYDGAGDVNCVIGTLYTDVGNFNVKIYFEPNSNMNKNVKLEIGELESNTLESNDWYRVSNFSDYFMMCASCAGLNGYQGNITPENIDSVVKTSIYYSDYRYFDYVIIEGVQYGLLEGEKVRKIIFELFGIENADLSMSNLYDKDSDTIKSPLDGFGGVANLKYISYENGKWSVVRFEEWSNNKHVSKVELDESLKVMTFNYCDGKDNHIFDDWTVTKQPTCTETGLKTQSCLYCDAVATQTISKNEHSYSPVVTTPTCIAKGYTTYTCECGDSYIDDYVDTVEHTLEWFVLSVASCQTNGVEHGYCENCSYYEVNTTPMTDHTDRDDDGYCDTCNELLETVDDCECNCHKSGISKFFFNLIFFFQKLFGSNVICDCGVAHY